VSDALLVFCRYLDKKTLLSAITTVAYPGGELDSIFSLTNPITSLVTAATSQRSDAIIIAILITDGAPIAHNAISVAAATALQAIGMNFCTICVTDRCPEDIVKSSSSPPREASHVILFLNAIL